MDSQLYQIPAELKLQSGNQNDEQFHCSVFTYN